MALFTDGPIATTEDLSDYDSSVLEVANTEGIDLTRKASLAQDEIAIELGNMLTGGDTLDNVVVTPPLRLWDIFHTLTLVYRDAYGSQLNDRYAGKRDEFEELEQWARGKLIESGLGVAWDPVPQAAAPQLTPTAGTLGPATVFASISWLNARGDEGAAGPAASITFTTGNTLVARALDRPLNAVSWNVFAGPGPDSLVQQNGAPLAADGEWVQATGLATVGRAPGNGQEPDCIRPLVRRLPRG